MTQAHPRPAHAAGVTSLIPGRSGVVAASNKIGTRTGTPATALRSHNVIDSARQASNNNPKVLSLVHGAAHALAQAGARLSVQFSIGPAGSGPNTALQALSGASVAGSAQSAAAVKTDLTAISLLNGSLGQFGLQVDVAHTAVYPVQSGGGYLGGRSSTVPYV